MFFWRRNVSESIVVSSEKVSLCFAPRLAVLKFFFGASGLRKFGLDALLPIPCPGRDDEKPPPPRGRLPAGAEGPPEPTGRNGLREAP
jgi:hypothetical protein